jgi:hypothetical protein
MDPDPMGVVLSQLARNKYSVAKELGTETEGRPGGIGRTSCLFGHGSSRPNTTQTSDKK